MTSPSNEPAKRRHLSVVAATTGVMRASEKSARDAAEKRGKAALAAQEAGATYKELREATGLTKVGVYKMLTSAAGGSLRDRQSGA